MIHKTYTTGWTREQWLEERKKSLGGSDMGAILGLNPYSSPYAVWADKTGKLPPAEDNEAMRQGRDLEDYVARRFMELTGKKVHRINAIIRNDNCPYMHACVDRVVSGEKSGLECKTASALSESKFKGGNFPTHYYAQCVDYLANTEYLRWYLAALILGKGFKVYQMTRIENDEVPDWCEGSVYVSDEEIAALKMCALNFWEQHVINDISPSLDGTKATEEAIKVIYADSEPDTECDLFAVGDKIERYNELSQIIKHFEAEQNAIKAEIQQYMGDVEKGFYNDYKISWKSQQRSTFDAKRFKADNPHIDLTNYYNKSTSRPFKLTTNN